MRFMKNTRLKDKALEFASKLILLAVTALFCLWMISGARAAGTPQITDLNVTKLENGSTRVELKLSESVEQKDVSVDFQRNFIQLSFRGVSAFPAKNKNVSEGPLDKIFTYQYQPDLARARLLLNGDALKFKAHTDWHVNGNSVVVNIGSHGIVAVANKPAKHDSVKIRAAAEEKQEKAVENSASQAAEDKIVSQILSDEKVAPKTAGQIKPLELKQEVKKDDDALFSNEHEKVAAKEALPASQSPIQRIVSGLLTVLVIMAAIALAFRKFVLGKGVKFNGFGVNFGARQNRLIDVVSTQSLGPKKSVSVIRVGDQYIVIGVTGENINLLTNLDAKANIEKYLEKEEESASHISFSNTLNRKMQHSDDELAVATGAGTNIINRGAQAAGASIRSSIKKRIEGFKPL